MVFIRPIRCGVVNNLLDSSVIFATLLTPDSGDTEDGLASPFFVCGASSIYDCMDLNGLLETTVTGMGYELTGVERPARGGLLRVYIDKPGGVNVDDCARVSNHLTRLFAVENVAFERLEVSSPGLDRPLRKAADFVRFAGAEADLRLRDPVDDARRIKGILRGCEDGAVLIETTAGLRTIPLDGIDKARLVPKIDWRKSP